VYAVTPIIVIAFVCAAILMWAFTGGQGARDRLTKLADKASGFALADDLKAAYVERIVRYQRRTIVGVSGGIAIGLFLPMVINVDFATGSGILITSGGCTLAGGVVAQTSSLISEARRRSRQPNIVVRENGVRLRDYLPPSVLFAAPVISVIGAAIVGISLWAVGSRAATFAVTATSKEFIIAVVGATAITVMIPGVFFLGHKLAHQRQAAGSQKELALDDAIFTRLLFALIVSATYAFVVGLPTILLAALRAVIDPNLVNVYPATRDATFVTLVGFLLVFCVIAAFKPEHHYLRALWPELHRQTKTDRAAAKTLRRADYAAREVAFARARRGLPPLESATSIAEKQPTANL